MVKQQQIYWIILNFYLSVFINDKSVGVRDDTPSFGICYLRFISDDSKKIIEQMNVSEG